MTQGRMVRWIVVAVFFSLLLRNRSVAQDASQAQKTEVTLAGDCKPNSDQIFRLVESSVPNQGKTTKAWRKRFYLAIIDLEAQSDLKTGQRPIFWFGFDKSGIWMNPQPLSTGDFAPNITTTDNVIAEICHSHEGDGAMVTPAAVLVNSNESIGGIGGPPPRNIVTPPSFNRYYLVDSAKGSDVLRIDFIGPAKQGEIPVKPDLIGQIFIERHKVVHFSLGGGFVVTGASLPAYSILTVPTTTITTTNVSAVTTATGTTTVTGSNQQTTVATASGTESFAYKQPTGRRQINALAGLTWYPFGNDLYPVPGETPNMPAMTYAWHDFKQHLGLFFGTTVNSLGNFTVGPAMEVYPGVQVLAASTFYSKSYLPPNVVPCSGYGTSTSYMGLPTTTSTQTQVVPGPPAATTVTTTTVSVSSTNGCSNGAAATPLAGANLPTQSTYRPAFSIGLIFNTNLMKAFSLFK